MFKELSKLTALVVVAFFGYDFMTTWITLSIYWYSNGGDPRVYGVILGLYGMMQAVGAPAMGWLSDRFGEYLVLLISLLLSAAGNGMYLASSAYPSEHTSAQVLIIFSRILCGFASASTVVALRHLVSSAGADHTALVSVMNMFRWAGIIGRMLGPTVAIAFLYIDPIPLGHASLNAATFPPVISAGVAVLVLVAVALTFRHTLSCGNEKQLYSPIDELQGSVWRKRDLFAMLVILTLQMTGLWFFYSQLVPITIFVYQIVTGVNNLWLGFMTSLAGSFGYSLLLNRLFLRMDVAEAHQISIMAVGMIVCIIPLFPFSVHPSEYFFWVASSFFFLFSTGLQTVLRALYSRLIQNSSNLGVLLSATFISNGIAQMVGSAIGGAVSAPKLDSAWFSDNNCSGFNQTYAPPSCANCTITYTDFFESDDYKLDCWKLGLYSVLLALMIVVFAIAAALMYVTVPKLLHEAPPFEEDSALSVNHHSGGDEQQPFLR